MKVIVTGGAGFIGSALIRYLINETNHEVLNIDKLTYAANLKSLDSISQSSRYRLIKEDITELDSISTIIQEFKPDAIFHLAAESHVDNSILNPIDFVKTNVLGTANLLHASTNLWKNLSEIDKENFRFLHISTDEVFGDLGDEGSFTEDTPYNPSSPYSASKAGSDHLVRAAFRTYGLPAIITNCSNNYGPYQHCEKLIPKVIQRIINGKKIPIYGSGLQVRDWLYVEDHVQALYEVYKNGITGQTYNIGGNNEKTNIEVINMICELIDKNKKYQFNGKSSSNLIHYVEDRPGHDRRYSIDASKIKNTLSWEPKTSFEAGIQETIEWYLNNTEILNENSI